MTNKLTIAALLATTALQAQTLQDGQTAYENDKLLRATSIFTQLLQAQPKNAELYYNLANVYATRDVNDSARIMYKKAAEILPASAYGFLAAARNILNATTTDATKAAAIATAKVNIDKAVALVKEKDVKIMHEAAYVYIKGATKNTTGALEIANKALLLDKKNADTYMLLGDIYTVINDGGLAAKNYDYAASFSPANPRPYQRTGVLFTQARNFIVAQENFNTALSKDANFAPAYRDLGELYYKAKKYDKAKDTYKKYLELSEPNTVTLTKYAYILFLKKDYTDATEVVNQVQRIDSSNIILKRLLGYSYCEQNKPKEGLASMQAFMNKIEPSRIIAEDYEYLAKLNFKNNKDSLAVDNFKKAMAMDTTKANLYYDLGETYYHWKKWLPAADAFRMKLAKSKAITAADYFGLGRSLYFGKQYQSSDSAFTKLIEMKPDYATGHLYRGKCNSIIHDKNPEPAKPFYDKFLELAEKDPKASKRDLAEAYSFLGYYNIQKNDNAKAKEFYNKVLSVDPENKQAKDVLAKIK
jgi:tetratricopeptide (TPR) repeat protein